MRRIEWLLAAVAVTFISTGAVSAQDAEPDEEGEARTAREAMQGGGMTEERDLADAEARARFTLGQSLYDQGNFSGAAAEFEAAYELSGRPALLYNAYIAHRDANDLDGAVRTLAGYLEEAEEVPQRVNLEARLARMRQGLEEREANQVARRQAEEEAAAAREAAARRPRPPEPQMWTWAIAGVGGAMMVAGIITGVLALDQAGALEDACPNNLCPPGFDASEARDELFAFSVATDILLFGGAALAIGGVLLGLIFGLPSGDDDEPPVAVGCGPDGCHGVYRTRF